MKRIVQVSISVSGGIARMHARKRSNPTDCRCGWKPGVWGCDTFVEHIARIITDLEQS